MLDKSEMIFGVRAVIEAIQAGKEIDKILVKKDIQSDLSKELFAALKGLLIPVQRVPVERINRITRKNHQGVVAFISSVTYQKTEDLVPFLFEQGKNPFFVMLPCTRKKSTKGRIKIFFISVVVSLFHSFINQNTGSYGNIQRFDGSQHRYLHPFVTESQMII